MSDLFSDVVAERIEHMRLTFRGPQGRKISQDVVAEAIGMKRQSYNNKCNPRVLTDRFDLDQAEAVAGYWRRMTGRRLIGWPYVDAETSDNFERVVDLLESRKRGTPRPAPHQD